MQVTFAGARPVRFGNDALTNRLKEALAAVEQSGDAMTIDEVAFIIAKQPFRHLFLEDRYGDNPVKELPKLKALIKEMVEVDGIDEMPRPQATLLLAGYRNREDQLGAVADLLIRRFCS